MRWTIVAQVLGTLLLALGVPLLLPLALNWWIDAPLGPWLWGLAVFIGCGLGLRLLGRRAPLERMSLREGMAVTVLLWLVGSALAGVPLWLATPVTFIEGWFEAMSGLTTTGSTIYGTSIPVAELGPAVHLWRSLLQWLGGLGVVVMSLALLPLLGGGSGWQLYQSEVSGITTDRLAPRIADTARLMLVFYALFTIATTVSLMACNVSIFVALNHAMAAVSTGGFSTYDNSVEGLQSASAEWVLVIAMAVGGMNFALLLAAGQGRWRGLVANAELRGYLLLLLAASALVALALYAQPVYDGHLHDQIRDSVFAVVSVVTTTGFCSGYDITGGPGWEAWPQPALAVLLMLMAIGGCAGSTAGGPKVARWLVLLSTARREFRAALEPARQTPVLVDGRPVRDGMLAQVGLFMGLFMVSWGMGTIILCFFGHDVLTSISAAITSLSNVGPGLGAVGAAHNFHELGGPSQFVCLLLMLLGRLEIIGVLALLTRSAWR
jgi:trk system potassium uptake protein TrkH